MSKKYFGTDGIRGRVGEAPITAEFVLHLGYAAGSVLAAADRRLSPDARPSVVIGKDTRISGYMLESALQAGLSAAGIDVLLLGPMPTPAVAYLTRAFRAQAGIVISASHNPYQDNGIKFFSAAGTKLADKTEQAIEARINEPIWTQDSISLGRAKRINDAAGRYIEFCKSTFPTEMDLRGLKLVLDCAHGATYHIAPHVFHELGAEVFPVAVQPNGLNINEGCGSTHTAFLQAAVAEHSADYGIAFDGDGDRVLISDRHGQVFDGDQLLYAIVKQRVQSGTLKGGVVGTAMTNLGFEHALEKLQVPFMRANVGDRYVLELLHNQGWHLGGETSGHIICRDKHTSGDGIISALQVLRALRANKADLGEFVRELNLYPQVLLNVPVPKAFDFRDSIPVQTRLVAAQSELKGMGRVLLRASGTEPLVRVMVEGKSSEKVKRWAEDIADTVRKAAHQSAAAQV